MSLHRVTDAAERTVRTSLTTTSATDLIPTGNNATTIHQILVANINGTATIDLYVSDGTTDTYLTKLESVAAKTRLQLDTNIRLEKTEALKAKASAVDTFDIFVTHMQSPQRAR